MHAVYAMTRSIPVVMIAASIVVGASAQARANVITDWDEKALAVVAPMPPYNAQRLIGMVHLAMFDAVNSIERRYRPYLVELKAEPTTSKEAAAAAAAATVLATIDPQTASDMKAARRAISPRSPMGRANWTASNWARLLRHGSWRHGQTTAPRSPMPTGRGPCQAFMCPHRSRQPPCGQT